MNYLQAGFLGIIEGLTEYLPISSTFHLIWTSKLLGIDQSEFQKAFEVIIQSGAILAVAVLYIKTFLNNKSLVLKVIISFIPTALIGLLLYKVIKNSFFDSYNIQLIIFALVGLFFIYFEKSKIKLSRTLESLTFKDALIIGLIQVLAVFPGVSRAGAVIVGMMYLGVKRGEAAKYSFLLAVPTLGAASLLDLYKVVPLLISHPENIGFLTVGFLMAFVSALIVVKWFTKYLEKNTLSNFGFYRIAIASLLFIILMRYSM